MTDATDVDPVEPEQAGVADETPDPMQVEAAKKLAIDARDRLRAEGFDDTQIDKWATTYTAEEGGGDVDAFVAWIDRQQAA